MKNTFFFSFILVYLSLNGQKYLEMMNDPKVNFYEVKKEANNYFSQNGIEKGSGYKAYKRWEYETEQRTYPSGDRTSIFQDDQLDDFEKLNRRSRQSRSTASGGWTLVGPSNGNSFFGAGRVNCMESDPNNSKIVYAGAGSGGIWKSIDGGLNWIPKGDFNQNLGVSSIAVDPSNSNVVYLATGDYDGGSTPSYGLLKSTNGGNTWVTTGLKFLYSDYMKISNVSIDPLKTSDIVVSTNAGIYLSTDNGVTFGKTVSSGNYGDLVRHPTNGSILYASTAFGTPQIFKSTNGGQTWSVSMAGITSGSTNKIILAVTPAAPNNVYAAAVLNQNTISGFYVSTNSGVSYQLKTTTMKDVWINQIGYNDCMAVSPKNANVIVFGAINVGRSLDGGATWSKLSEWDNPHCDVHWLHYDKNGTLFNGNDGGMWNSNDDGTTWVYCNGNFTAQQYYGMGQSVGAVDAVMAGAQDNGFHILSNSSWKQGHGGDAMKCIVDYSNPNFMVGLGIGGHVLQTDNAGQTWRSNLDPGSGIPYGQGEWVTPICQHPTSPKTYFIGFRRVWKSTNGCENWTAISTEAFNGGGLNNLVISASDTNKLYASKSGQLYKSLDGGRTWSELYVGVTIQNYEFITSIAISPLNPLEIWISKSGYRQGAKIFKSIDGGTTWVNMSLNLPNIPFNTIAIQGDSEGSIYVGSDEGVYYKNNNMSEWLTFDAQLPNVIVKELIIYKAKNKIRACTYGRGVWESDLYAIPSQTLEAEDASLSGPQVLKGFLGYTGSGYADFQNLSSDYIEWSYNAPADGSYSIDFKYALVSATRTNQVFVNDVSVIANLAFPTTNSWSTWNYTSQNNVLFKKGLNKIKLLATGTSGANIDHLRITSNLVITELEELLQTDGLLVYPNPSKDVINIELSEKHMNENTTISLLDIHGNNIISEQLTNSNTFIINSSTLVNGVYLVEINSNIGSINKKIIIAH